MLSFYFTDAWNLNRAVSIYLFILDPLYIVLLNCLNVLNMLLYFVARVLYGQVTCSQRQS